MLADRQTNTQTNRQTDTVITILAANNQMYQSVRNCPECAATPFLHRLVHVRVLCGRVHRRSFGGWGGLVLQTLDHGQYFALILFKLHEIKLTLRKMIKIVATRR